MGLSKFAALFVGMLGLGLVGGCAIEVDEDVFGIQGVATRSAKLNLSHIACEEDGSVQVHFVLLFAGKGTPGQLTGTWSGGTFSASPYKASGNVWHYQAFLPTGYIEILSAQVATSSGTLVTLHNPSEYTGDYQCGEQTTCEITVEPQELYCSESPLGNPQAECGAFGLVPSGKDDNLTGHELPAGQTAYVAIVKAGNHGCDEGDAAYRIYVNVNKGEVLQSPNDQQISHVTYCDCPADVQ